MLTKSKGGERGQHVSVAFTLPPVSGFWADRTALHEAASHGRTLQLKQLIESGASVNMVTVDNITPLHEACIQAHPNCARLLLEAGAQVG